MEFRPLRFSLPTLRAIRKISIILNLRAGSKTFMRTKKRRSSDTFGIKAIFLDSGIFNAGRKWYSDFSSTLIPCLIKHSPKHNHPASRVLSILLYRNKKVRQQPTFPTNVSIIGVRELDFRVRDGNGYCLSTMATGQFIINYPLHTLCKRLSTGTKGMSCNKTNRYAQKFLSGINNMVKPHDLLVPLGCIRRRTYTCGLSTG